MKLTKYRLAKKLLKPIKPLKRACIYCMLAVISFTVIACSSGLSTKNRAPANQASLKQTPYIVVDQFGYRPEMQKIAVLRDPKVGFDAKNAYTPGNQLLVINTSNDEAVYENVATQWKGGQIDESSGDRAWWFDFSPVKNAGEYYILDPSSNRRSASFSITENPYKRVLKHAFRTFYYQRAGFPKQPPFAEQAWADKASHLGPGQDTEARLYSKPDSPETERDLHGGWYDAGDYNKYTSWTAYYVIYLLHSYQEKPSVWGDNFEIPESGNGIPDILDEVKWGLEFLQRMQNENGSVLSIVSLDHASPPSKAGGPSFYGSENTSATLSTAAAFALAASIYGKQNNHELKRFAQQLKQGAESAWHWADNNPQRIFKNNDAEFGTKGLGAGQQEVDDQGRFDKKLEAAVYLFELTGNSKYKEFFENNFSSSQFIQSRWSNPFRVGQTHSLLYYAQLKNISPEVAKTIQSRFLENMQSANRWPAIDEEADPYRAFLSSYTWGSSGIRADIGNLFFEQSIFNIGTRSEQQIRNAAARYIHYLHGVNSLGKTYLSNMGDFGAENSVDQFYHSWFTHGSAAWDSVQESHYGPAPGFLVGGPNPHYNWDRCCPANCGRENNHHCKRISPPYGQPAQKSYWDFNESWPLNSWEITENSNGYQVRYLRLLSKFVD